MIPQTQDSLEEKKVQIYKLFQYGSAECDQFEIPNDDSFESRRPVEQSYFLKNSIHIHQIACGALHTLLLTTTGQVYSWGCNDDGALGRESAKEDASPADPPLSKESAPGLVPLDLPMDMISAGDSHSIACNSKNGVVYLWGVYRNTVGGNMSSQLKKPTRWGEDTFYKKTINKVLSGCNHSLILCEERVYAWGDPDTCVLGRMPLARRKFTQGLHIEAMSTKHVVDVYTGGYHSFIKQRKKASTKKDSKEKEDQEVILAWGLNNYGQLGLGSTENSYKAQEIACFRNLNIQDIQGGDDFTIVLTKSGDVYSFGRCDDGQCGLGEDWKSKINAGKKGDIDEEEKQVESVVEKKFEYVTTPIKIDSIDNIDKIYCGSAYVYAISRQKNHVYSWGSGDHYILGNGKEDGEMAPYIIKPAFFKQEELIEVALGGQHVTLITSNMANGWTLPELEPIAFEINKALLFKKKGRKTGKESSRSPSKGKSVEKEKKGVEKMEEIKDLDEKEEEIDEERNEKKRKMGNLDIFGASIKKESIKEGGLKRIKEDK